MKKKHYFILVHGEIENWDLKINYNLYVLPHDAHNIGAAVSLVPSSLV